MIVLDTHIWIWWTTGEQSLLSAAAREAIQLASPICVSAWSCWEVATLARRGRIELDRPTERWIADSQISTALELLPVDQRIATAAGSLSDDFPGDPSDRIIYSTAVAHGLPLVTRDEAIRAFDPARTIW